MRLTAELGEKKNQKGSGFITPTGSGKGLSGHHLHLHHRSTMATMMAANQPKPSSAQVNEATAVGCYRSYHRQSSTAISGSSPRKCVWGEGASAAIRRRKQRKASANWNPPQQSKLCHGTTISPTPQPPDLLFSSTTTRATTIQVQLGFRKLKGPVSFLFKI